MAKLTMNVTIQTGLFIHFDMKILPLVQSQLRFSIKRSIFADSAKCSLSEISSNDVSMTTSRKIAAKSDL